VTSVTGSSAEVSALYAAGDAGTITGLGGESVVVIGPVAADSDLTRVDDDLDFGTEGGLTISVNTGAKLTLTAVQATGKTIDGPGTATIIADSMVDNATLATAGSAAMTITGLQANLTDTSTAAQNITVASVASQITLALGADLTGTDAITATVLTDGQVLTLTGANDATVAFADGDINASTYTGALTVTGTGTTGKFTTGTVASSISSTGATEIDATAMADDQTLTTSGAGPITVTGLVADLIASATTGAVDVTAGSGSQSIETGSGYDIITGGTGDDTFIGGRGNDTFVISYIETSGSDQFFKFTTSTDVATVAEGRDTLQFSTVDLLHVVGFTAAGSGAALTLLDGSNVAFVEGAGAVSTDAVATFVYDDTTGVLSFDADGTGAEAAINVGTFYSDSGLTLVNDILAADFNFTN
jgi:hypothetical protein